MEQLKNTVNERPVKTLEDFGGDDSKADNTDAFVEAALFFENSSGGTLILKEGVWKTGPIKLVSNMTLQIEKGAVLSFIPDPARYIPVFTRWEGVMCWGMHPCLYAADAVNVTVCGEGKIDGNGSTWWNLYKSKKTQAGPTDEIEKHFATLNPGYKNQPGGGGGRNIQFLRPPLVQFYSCENSKIQGVTLQNSPFWTIHPVFCRDLSIQDVTVKNPGDAPNTDGIDIDSCEYVEITNCKINVGDDAIALKSGSGEDGIRMNRPTSNVKISGCVVNQGHGGVVIGSETAAGINTVEVDNCKFVGTDRGIRIKTRRQRGGAVKNLLFKNLEMQENICPVAINMFYCCGTKRTEPEFFSQEPLPVQSSTPSVHDVLIEDINATGCKASAGFIAGLPECKIKNLVIRNSKFVVNPLAEELPNVSDMFAGVPDTCEKSFRVLFADDPTFENVSIEGIEKPFLFA